MERAELSDVLRPWLRGEQGAGGREPILISEPEASRFMAAFADAVAGDTDVFLCDSSWGTTEKAQVDELLRSKIENHEAKMGRGWLMIPTGGSSGQLKFARHDQDTIAAAVHGFSQHFGLLRVNAIGLLPLHHVSGLMAWMRCALTGGEYRHLDWKAVEQGDLPELPAMPDGWVLSVVPTQLERLMRQPMATAWLAKFRIVFIGGAPAGRDLLDRAAAARIPLSQGYGMTETAAMVTALRPEEFLAAGRSSGAALPHARVALSANGTILVAGGSLFRGYFPGWHTEADFKTNDTGRLDEMGRLQVIGRHDEVILTGGEKVNPADVEAVLRGTGELREVIVVGVPDPEWGQVVVAAFPAWDSPDRAKLAPFLAQLAPAKRPKHFVALAVWPKSGAGKVIRAEVARLAGLTLRSGPDKPATPG
jgi:O-succinylbenzoic acid--CoA ligase